MARESRPYNIGPMRRSSFVRVFISNGRMDRALEVLKWTSGPLAKHESSFPFMTFIRFTARFKFSNPDCKLRALQEMMKIMPDYITLSHRWEVVILSLFLPKSFSMAMERINQIANGDEIGGRSVRDIMYAVMTQGFLVHQTTPLASHGSCSIACRSRQVRKESWRGNIEHIHAMYGTIQINHRRSTS